MNFDQAKEAMINGHKVKLPEWTGYWFADGLNIGVLTKNGDVLDTPHIEKHKDRDDWEITDGGMGFDFAILSLQNGKKLQRKGWNGKGMYLWLLPAAEVKREWIKDPMLLEVFGDRDTLPMLGCIRMKTDTGEVLTGWLASQSDMLAKDWQIVE
jgi:hypothetical protein